MFIYNYNLLKLLLAQVNHFYGGKKQGSRVIIFHNFVYIWVEVHHGCHYCVENIVCSFGQHCKSRRSPFPNHASSPCMTSDCFLLSQHVYCCFNLQIYSKSINKNRINSNPLDLGYGYCKCIFFPYSFIEHIGSPNCVHLWVWNN